MSTNGISVMLPAYVGMLYYLSPLIVYPLAYRFNIKFYLVHITYLAVILTIGLIALKTIDNPENGCSSENHPFSDDVLFSIILILPFVFALRGVIGYYKPVWFGKDSSRPARKYIYMSMLLLIPAILVVAAYGAISFGCQ